MTRIKTTMTRDELKTALTFLDDTAHQIQMAIRKLGWAGLEPIERSIWLHSLRIQIRKSGGRLVAVRGVPIVWTAEDDRIHGGCRLPAWTA